MQKIFWGLEQIGHKSSSLGCSINISCTIFDLLHSKICHIVSNNRSSRGQTERLTLLTTLTIRNHPSEVVAVGPDVISVKCAIHSSFEVWKNFNFVMPGGMVTKYWLSFKVGNQTWPFLLCQHEIPLLLPTKRNERTALLKPEHTKVQAISIFLVWPFLTLTIFTLPNWCFCTVSCLVFSMETIMVWDDVVGNYNHVKTQNLEINILEGVLSEVLEVM